MFGKLKVLFYIFLLCAYQEVAAQKAEKPLFRFGVVADVQYADRENLGTRHYRSSLQKLAEAVQVFNTEKPDLIVSLGDYINNDFKSFAALKEITRHLKMPLHHVTGNHDYEVMAHEKDQVLPALSLKKAYYALEKKNWKLIFLNGNDISLIGNKEGSSKYQEAEKLFEKITVEGIPNAKPWNGGLSQEQKTWLQQELNNAQKKKQKVIVLCHFPLYPDNSPYTLWNTAEIRALIESYPNVKAYLNGHVHQSQYFLGNKVHYVTFEGMVEKDENAFAIISVYKDRLEIKGYGKEVDRILK